ncbi:MAG: protein kinase domain-containing protein [Bacteroidota bacterium]
MNDFEVIRPLGSGKKRRFNEVFLVRNKLTQQEAVLKYLEKTPANSSGQELLRQEASFVFDHPCLPRVIQFRETDQAIFLLKNYTPGIPLDEYWKKLPEKEQKPFIYALLCKLSPLLEELRRKKIVHGDIKPSNIIINKQNTDFEAALIDFGLAFYPEKTQERSLVFALGFSAPELILNKLHLAKQSSDLFSLGIVIAQLLEGKLPLSHANPAVMTNLQLTHPLVRTPKIPKKLFPVLAKMCFKESFPKPPQMLGDKMVDDILVKGIEGRYQSIPELLPELEWMRESNKKGVFTALVKIFANPEVKGKE